ncbi:MAG: GmrSD restriction endonuclease domain-containing protein [Actinomycetota bacterium]
MALETLSVSEIVEWAVSKKMDIPEFQRQFVWDPEQVKLLAESLYREYPVGSLLLWDSTEYTGSKTAMGSEISLWIVDGQQRITALAFLLNKKPYWWPSADLWNKALLRYDPMVNVLSEDEQLDFALANPIRRKDPRWVSIRDVLSVPDVEQLTRFAQQVASGIETEPEKAMELFPKIHARLNRLWQIRNQTIPLMKIRHEIEDVAEIFARLNQAGTRVKEADVILALASVKNPNWIREEYMPFQENLEEKGWELDAGIFIRTLTSIGAGRARLVEVPRDFWEEGSLMPVWEQCKITTAEVIKRMAEFGILNGDLLPSKNSLTPLFALHHKWKDSPSYDFKKALYWFLLANRDGRYSGSSITNMNEDVRALNEAESFDSALERLLGRLRVNDIVDEAEFLGRYDRAGNRFYRLLYFINIFKNGAKDWVDHSLIGYDKTGGSLLKGFQPNWHHIFPRSLLKKNGFPEDEVQALANITVLNERTNVLKLTSLRPAHYERGAFRA